MSTIASQLAMAVNTPMGRQNNVSLLFDQQQANDTDTATIFNLARNGLTELIKDHYIFSHFSQTLFREIPPFNLNIDDYKKELKAFLYLITPLILKKEVHKCLEFLIRTFHINEHAFSVKILLTAIIPYSATALFPKIVNLCSFQDSPALRFFTRVKTTRSAVPRSTIALAATKEVDLLEFLITHCYKYASLSEVHRQLRKVGIHTVSTPHTSTSNSNLLASFITLFMIDFLAIFDINKTKPTNQQLKLIISFVSRCLVPQSDKADVSNKITEDTKPTKGNKKPQAVSSVTPTNHVTSNLSIGAYMILTNVCYLVQLDYTVLTTIMSLLIPSIPHDSPPQIVLYPLMCLMSLLQSQRTVLLDKSFTKVGGDKKQKLAAQSRDSYIIMLPLDIIRSLVRLKYLREAILLLNNSKGYDVSQLVAALVVGLAKYLLLPASGFVEHGQENKMVDGDSNAKAHNPTHLIINIPFFELLLLLCENASHTSIIDPTAITALVGTVLNCFARAMTSVRNNNATSSKVLSASLTKYLHLFFNTMNYHHPDALQHSISAILNVLQIHPYKTNRLVDNNSTSPSSTTATSTVSAAQIIAQSDTMMNDIPTPSADNYSPTASANANNNGIKGYFLDFLHKTAFESITSVLSIGLQCTKHQLLSIGNNSNALTIAQALSPSNDNLQSKLIALTRLNTVISDLQDELIMYHRVKQQQLFGRNKGDMTSTSNKTTTTGSEDNKNGDNQSGNAVMTDLESELAFLDQGLFSDETQAAETKKTEKASKKSEKTDALSPTTIPSGDNAVGKFDINSDEFTAVRSMPLNVINRHIRQTQSTLDDSIKLLLTTVLTETQPMVIIAIIQMSFWRRILINCVENFTKVQTTIYMRRILDVFCIILEKILSVFGTETTSDSTSSFHSALQYAHYLEALNTGDQRAQSNDVQHNFITNHHNASDNHTAAFKDQTFASNNAQRDNKKSSLNGSSDIKIVTKTETQLHKINFIKRTTEQTLFTILRSLLYLLCSIHHQFPVYAQHGEDMDQQLINKNGDNTVVEQSSTSSLVPHHTVKLLPYFLLLLTFPQQPTLSRLIDSYNPEDTKADEKKSKKSKKESGDDKQDDIMTTVTVKTLDIQHLRLSLALNSGEMYSIIAECCQFLSNSLDNGANIFPVAVTTEGNDMEPTTVTKKSRQPIKSIEFTTIEQLGNTTTTPPTEIVLSHNVIPIFASLGSLSTTIQSTSNQIANILQKITQLISPFANKPVAQSDDNVKQTKLKYLPLSVYEQIKSLHSNYQSTTQEFNLTTLTTTFAQAITTSLQSNVTTQPQLVTLLTNLITRPFQFPTTSSRDQVTKGGKHDKSIRNTLFHDRTPFRGLTAVSYLALGVTDKLLAPPAPPAPKEAVVTKADKKSKVKGLNLSNLMGDEDTTTPSQPTTVLLTSTLLTISTEIVTFTRSSVNNYYISLPQHQICDVYTILSSLVNNILKSLPNPYNSTQKTTTESIPYTTWSNAVNDAIYAALIAEPLPTTHLGQQKQGGAKLIAPTPFSYGYTHAYLIATLYLLCVSSRQTAFLGLIKVIFEHVPQVNAIPVVTPEAPPTPRRSARITKGTEAAPAKGKKATAFGFGADSTAAPAVKQLTPITNNIRLPAALLLPLASFPAQFLEQQTSKAYNPLNSLPANSSQRALDWAIAGVHLLAVELKTAIAAIDSSTFIEALDLDVIIISLLSLLSNPSTPQALGAVVQKALFTVFLGGVKKNAFLTADNVPNLIDLVNFVTILKPFFTQDLVNQPATTSVNGTFIKTGKRVNEMVNVVEFNAITPSHVACLQVAAHKLFPQIATAFNTMTELGSGLQSTDGNLAAVITALSNDGQIVIDSTPAKDEKLTKMFNTTKSIPFSTSLLNILSGLTKLIADISSAWTQVIKVNAKSNDVTLPLTLVSFGQQFDAFAYAITTFQPITPLVQYTSSTTSHNDEDDNKVQIKPFTSPSLLSNSTPAFTLPAQLIVYEASRSIFNYLFDQLILNLIKYSQMMTVTPKTTLLLITLLKSPLVIPFQSWHVGDSIIQYQVCLYSESILSILKKNSTLFVSTTTSTNYQRLLFNTLISALGQRDSQQRNSSRDVLKIDADGEQDGNNQGGIDQIFTKTHYDIAVISYIRKHQITIGNYKAQLTAARTLTATTAKDVAPTVQKMHQHAISLVVAQLNTSSWLPSSASIVTDLLFSYTLSAGLFTPHLVSYDDKLNDMSKMVKMTKVGQNDKAAMIPSGPLLNATFNSFAEVSSYSDYQNLLSLLSASLQHQYACNTINSKQVSTQFDPNGVQSRRVGLQRALELKKRVVIQSAWTLFPQLTASLVKITNLLQLSVRDYIITVSSQTQVVANQLAEARLRRTGTAMDDDDSDDDNHDESHLNGHHDYYDYMREQEVLMQLQAQIAEKLKKIVKMYEIQHQLIEIMYYIMITTQLRATTAATKGEQQGEDRWPFLHEYVTPQNMSLFVDILASNTVTPQIADIMSMVQNHYELNSLFSSNSNDQSNTKKKRFDINATWAVGITKATLGDHFGIGDNDDDESELQSSKWNATFGDDVTESTLVHFNDHQQQQLSSLHTNVYRIMSREAVLQMLSVVIDYTVTAKLKQNDSAVDNILNPIDPVQIATLLQPVYYKMGDILHYFTAEMSTQEYYNRIKNLHSGSRTTLVNYSTPLFNYQDNNELVTYNNTNGSYNAVSLKHIVHNSLLDSFVRVLRSVIAPLIQLRSKLSLAVEMDEDFASSISTTRVVTVAAPMKKKAVKGVAVKAAVAPTITTDVTTQFLETTPSSPIGVLSHINVLELIYGYNEFLTTDVLLIISLAMMYYSSEFYMHFYIENGLKTRAKYALANVTTTKSNLIDAQKSRVGTNANVDADDEEDGKKELTEFEINQQLIEQITQRESSLRSGNGELMLKPITTNIIVFSEPLDMSTSTTNYLHGLLIPDMVASTIVDALHTSAVTLEMRNFARLNRANNTKFKTVMDLKSAQQQHSLITLSNQILKLLSPHQQTQVLTNFKSYLFTLPMFSASSSEAIDASMTTLVQKQLNTGLDDGETSYKLPALAEKFKPFVSKKRDALSPIQAFLAQLDGDFEDEAGFKQHYSYDHIMKKEKDGNNVAYSWSSRSVDSPNLKVMYNTDGTYVDGKMHSGVPIGFTATILALLQAQKRQFMLKNNGINNRKMIKEAQIPSITLVNLSTLLLQHALTNLTFSFAESKLFTRPLNEASLYADEYNRSHVGNGIVVKDRYSEENGNRVSESVRAETTEECVELLNLYQDTLVSFVQTSVLFETIAKQIRSFIKSQKMNSTYFAKEVQVATAMIGGHYDLMNTNVNTLLANIVAKQLSTIGFTTIFKNAFTHMALLGRSVESGLAIDGQVEVPFYLVFHQNPLLLHHIALPQSIASIYDQPHFANTSGPKQSKLGANGQILTQAQTLSKLTASFESTHENFLMPLNNVFQRFITLFISRLSFEREILFAESFLILLGGNSSQQESTTYKRAQLILQTELSEDYSTRSFDHYYAVGKSHQFGAFEDSSTANDDFDLDGEEVDGQVDTMVDSDDEGNDKLHQNLRRVRKNSRSSKLATRRARWLLILAARRKALLGMIPWLVNHIVLPSLPTPLVSQLVPILSKTAKWTPPSQLLQQSLSNTNYSHNNKAAPITLEHLQVALLSLDELVGLAYSLYFPMSDPRVVLKLMVFNHEHHKSGTLLKNETMKEQLAAVPTDSTALLLSTCQVLFLTMQYASTQAFSTGIQNEMVDVIKNDLAITAAGTNKKVKGAIVDKKSRNVVANINTTPSAYSDFVIPTPATVNDQRSWLAVLCSALMCTSTVLQRLQSHAIILVNKITSFDIALLLKSIALLHQYQQLQSFGLDQQTLQQQSMQSQYSEENQGQLVNSAAKLMNATSSNNDTALVKILLPDHVSMLQLSSLSLLHTLILVFGDMLQPFHLPIAFILCHPGTVIVQTSVEEQQELSSGSGDQSRLNVLRYSHSEASLRNAALSMSNDVPLHNDDNNNNGFGNQFVSLGGPAPANNTAQSLADQFILHSTSSILQTCLTTFAVTTNPSLLLPLLTDIHSVTVALGPVAVSRVISIAHHLLNKIGIVFAHVKDKRVEIENNLLMRTVEQTGIDEDQLDILEETAAAGYNLDDCYPHLLQLLLLILDLRADKGGLELTQDESLDYSEDQVAFGDDDDDELDEDQKQENEFMNMMVDSDEEDQENTTKGRRGLKDRGFLPDSDDDVDVEQYNKTKVIADDSDNADDDDEEEDEDDESEVTALESKNQELLNDHRQLTSAIKYAGAVVEQTRQELSGNEVQFFTHQWLVSMESVLLKTTSFDTKQSSSYHFQWTSYEINLIEQDGLQLLNDLVLLLDPDQLTLLMASLEDWVGIKQYVDSSIKASAQSLPSHKSLLSNYNSFDDQQEEHRQRHIVHLQRQLQLRLPRFLVFAQICHIFLHSIRHLFIPYILDHCGGYLIAALTPLDSDVMKDFILRKKSQQENKCFKLRSVEVDIATARNDGIFTGAVVQNNNDDEEDQVQYQTGANGKRKAVNSAKGKVKKVQETTTISAVTASSLLLHTTWFSHAVAILVDMVRVMLLIDISYVQTSTVKNTSQYHTQDVHGEEIQDKKQQQRGKHVNSKMNIHGDRKQKHDHKNREFQRANISTQDNLVIKSLFRELLPKTFVEQLVVLIVAQLQHGHKIRHFLPSAIIPSTVDIMLYNTDIINNPDLDSDEKYTLQRQQRYLLLTLPSLKSEIIRDMPQLPYTLVAPNLEVSLAKTQRRNLYQYSVYVEQLLVPTMATMCEYLHSTQPMLWESVVTLLGSACSSKFLQIRFAALSSFLALLQPQSCIRALITARGGVRAGLVTDAAISEKMAHYKRQQKVEQPAWSNEFFHACIGLFVPAIAETLQDSSLHVQRLSQSVVRLTESISGESFSNYLSNTQ